MVFSYSKYNLGTDFTVFLYLSVVAVAISIWAFFHTSYLYCFKLERRGDESTAAPRSAVGTDNDSELVAYRSGEANAS